MPFGFEKKLLGRSLVLLDKSYLQAVSGPHLEYLSGDRVFFISDVLLYELLRAVDKGRTRSL